MKTLSEEIKKTQEKYNVTEKVARISVTNMRNAREAKKLYFMRKGWLDADGLRDFIEETNSVMAQVLSDAGIRTHQLFVTYSEPDCQICPFYDISTGDCTDGYLERDTDCERKKITATISFYSYSIDDGVLDGITSAFKKASFDVISVKDSDGTILYQEKEYTDEKR